MIPPSFLKQCIAEVLLEPMSEANLRCAVCGGNAKGKQWFNQDKGYGVCPQCVTNMRASGKETEDSIAKSYGKEGTHFNPVKKTRAEKANAFIKECIAEVIIEPHRSLHVHGNPKRLMTAHLIKECVMEVLKENLTEGFDPLSDAGPNVPQENPYPEWNNKMRKLEETEKQAGAIYKAQQGGQWVYWMNNFDGAGKIPLQPESVKKYIRQGYRLVNLEPSEVKEESHPHGRYAQEAGATPLNSTFTEIRNKYDPDGTKHDLTLKCVKCGTTQSFRCSKPKRTFEGVCDKCAKQQTVREQIQKLNEQYPIQSTSIKWKCPHCSSTTKILIEIESPSDYISCADCDNCGKEISDPQLDAKVYTEVINHYAGRSVLK